MSLVKHAKRELKLAGLFDKDSDYDGMIGKAVVDLMKTFSKQGHSGFSANYTREIFNKLAQFKNLTKLTNDPTEWMDVSEYFEGQLIWQNNRCSSFFSLDLRTCYNVNDKKLNWLQKIFIPNHRGFRLTTLAKGKCWKCN